MTGATPNARIDGLFELAFRRHEAGQLREAEQLYRDILAADPRQIDCLHFLGMIALQSGRPADAVDLIGQAIAANDRIAAYHGSIAEAHRMLGRRDDAIAHFRKAVTIDPGYWAAHSMLAGLLLEQGHAGEALDAASRALAAQDSEPSRALFVQCVRGARELPGEPAFREQLTRALAEGWGRPVELAGAALSVVAAGGVIRSIIEAIEGVWPRRAHPKALAQPIGLLTQDALLHRVMEATPVCHDGMERLLSCVRTLLLDAALDPSADIAPEMLPFACTLARQCFINEYVFQLPDVERDGMMALRGKLKADLPGATPVLAITLIAYACYAPLRSLDRDAAILKRQWPEPMQALLDQQLREPEEEARCRAAMPRLTAVSDETSVRVRQQYEESPYPRWTRPAPVRPAPGIAAYLADELGFALPRALPQGAEILIAGCGTGQQPIETALRFPSARVLGIDLSLTSLAYAQRKAAELKIGNIGFGQADLLAFDPPQPFDVIEACGVLHHLADPFAGWTRLLRMLKPGAVMRLGFYSALARADIVAAREFVAAGGYDGTPESIRSCRQNLMKSPDPRLQRVPASPDFYSISACRDLLLHVQEHRLTLLEIAAFLAEHRLAFLGFELGAAALAQYRARFPEDAAMKDLAKWHLFESEHPDTFGGMYMFWVQKSE